MIEKILFLYHGSLSTNSPSQQTVSAGLGPAGQWIIILIILLLIFWWVYSTRKKGAIRW